MVTECIFYWHASNFSTNSNEETWWQVGVFQHQKQVRLPGIAIGQATALALALALLALGRCEVKLLLSVLFDEGHGKDRLVEIDFEVSHEGPK